MLPHPVSGPAITTIQKVSIFWVQPLSQIGYTGGTMGPVTTTVHDARLASLCLATCTSAKQIQRVSEHYGSKFDELIRSNCDAVIPRLEDQNIKDPLYIMVDGSMICTRGQKRWREMKLGRIFKGSQVVEIQSNRRMITKSIYTAHLGSVDDFFAKFERHLVTYKKRIIIGDGAAWIWKWAENNYPGAVQILDYYHAKEKLVILARLQILD